jgi:hypothetical protein
VAVGLVFSSSAEAAVFWSGNGNHYDFVAGQITWESAKAAAESLTFNGVSGHLVTITSSAEDNFLLNSFGLIPNVWIGASDAEQEGSWKWVTGPETGTIFWFGDATGVPVNGAYSNWNTGEPNNNFSSTGEMENYAVWNHQTAIGQIDFAWNDIPNNPNASLEPQSLISGYIVEYETGMSSPVPEPASMLGLLAVGAVAAGSALKKRPAA